MTFSRLSGEVINYHKSHIMFSPNTPSRFKRFMRSIIGTPSADSLGKYLGCDVEVDGRSSRNFLPLVDKVEKRVSSWHHLALSHAGRVVLINSIISMLSLNILSVFLIPKTIADKLNSVFSRFVWGGSKETKPIFWKSKNVLELPKDAGGLGIRNVHMFNKALLAQQAYRIHNSNQTLISQILCSKYKGSPLNIVLSNSPLARATWGFRGLCRAIQDCREGFTKIIGDGANTSILSDKWLRGEPVKVKQGVSLSNLGVQQVKDLIDSNGKKWKHNLIWQLFQRSSAIRILATHIPQSECQDHYIWSESKTGHLNTKKLYAHFMVNKGSLDGPKGDRKFWSKLWVSDLSPKWKFFTWQLLNKALATNANLIKRNIPVQANCFLCHDKVENESHLFRDCDISSRV